MKVIGYTVVTIVFVFINNIWSGYVLSKLWEWFVVSAFSLPSITIPTAIGISLIMSYLTSETKLDTESREYGEILQEGFIKGLLRPAFSLLVGWVVILFM